MLILMETGMAELPHDCLSCTVTGCPLPQRPDGTGLYKVYMDRRHGECPLRVVVAQVSHPPRKQGGYRGFLAIQCSECGTVRAFCVKKSVTNCYCRNCGTRVELDQLRRLEQVCTCGHTADYWTNAGEGTPVACIHCGALVPLLDRKEGAG